MRKDILAELQYFKCEKVYDDKILIISMNRPPVNAFIKDSYEELSTIIHEIHKDEELTAVILRSEGRIFSAGADINQLAEDTPERAALRRAALRKAGADLYTCPLPLITAVHGAAVGAGSIFAACGDIVIAADNAFFSLPEINVGVVGGAKGLARFLPPQKVRAMALTGMSVSAEEAFRLGGVEAIVPENDLLAKALEYAKMIADKGAIAARKWKESLIVTEAVGPREGFLIEQCLSQELGLLKNN